MIYLVLLCMALGALIATIGQLKTLGVPVKLSDTPGGVRSAPPTLGQHTDAVLLHDLGMSADEVTALRSGRVI